MYILSYENTKTHAWGVLDLFEDLNEALATVYAILPKGKFDFSGKQAMVVIEHKHHAYFIDKRDVNKGV